MKLFPVIFSDIDGTILDFDSYSYQISLPAIKKLTGRGIPLILVSSKTYEEIQTLHKLFGLHYPFIFENGAGIGFPDGTTTILGKSYETLIHFKDTVHSLIPDIVWADSLTIKELMNYTGLTQEGVKHMMLRRASVLFVANKFLDISAINKELSQHGIAITTGGKFYTVIDSTVNKGAAIQKVTQVIQEKFSPIYTYAIGDGINDCEMFCAVDQAFFVGKQSFFDYIQKRCTNVIKSRLRGPEGFADVVEQILQNYSVT